MVANAVTRPVEKVPLTQSGAVEAPCLHREERSTAASTTARCQEHPDEPATYFCVSCECLCICSDCVVHGSHRGHEVMRVARAHEALRARAGGLLDEALALEDDLAVVADKLAWRRKDIERAAARGRASVRSAFARVRAQLAEREQELLESLDVYESDSVCRLDRGTSDHDHRLTELRRLQESLRSRCRGSDPGEALNAYAAAKASITSMREAFQQEEFTSARSPEDFVNLAGSARAELDLHAEGLASLEEAVAQLCERGVDLGGGPRQGKVPRGSGGADNYGERQQGSLSYNGAGGRTPGDRFGDPPSGHRYHPEH